MILMAYGNMSVSVRPSVDTTLLTTRQGVETVRRRANAISGRFAMSDDDLKRFAAIDDAFN